MMKIDKSFKKDKDFVLDAIKIDAKALLYVDDSLNHDKSFILKALKVNPKVFQHLP